MTYGTFFIQMAALSATAGVGVSSLSKFRQKNELGRPPYRAAWWLFGWAAHPEAIRLPWISRSDAKAELPSKKLS